MDFVKDWLGVSKPNIPEGLRCEECNKFKDKVEDHNCSDELISDFSDISHIGEFYNGKGVFVTGGTGFLGKVLIEKLLRCTPVKNVYVLLRSKKGKDISERLEVLKASKIFRKIRAENPDKMDKLIPITGDILLPNLGIGVEDMDLLVKQVSLVFHSAATVKFNEPLKVAIEMNAVGTRKMLNLCKNLPLLDAFVYVSTAYANCNMGEIDEMVYPTKMNLDDLTRITSTLSDEALAEITPHFLEGRPNTYTFSKAIAENLIVSEKGDMPVAIVRPSIVVGALREPVRGWVDNTVGPSGMMAVISKGILKSGHINVDTVVDIIPVDIVINSLIVAGWNVGTTKPNEPLIYNITTGCMNPIYWKMVEEYAIENILKYPCQELYRYPGGAKFTKSRLLNQTRLIFGHYLPGYFADILAPLVGYKPGIMKLYKKIRDELEVLEFFYLNQWKFHCKNVTSLDSKMSPLDREIFNFDVKNIMWKQYFEGFTLGVREFIHKEDLTTLPAGRVTLNRMYYVNKGVDVLGIMFLLTCTHLIFDLSDLIGVLS